VGAFECSRVGSALFSVLSHVDRIGFIFFSAPPTCLVSGFFVLSPVFLPGCLKFLVFSLKSASKGR